LVFGLKFPDKLVQTDFKFELKGKDSGFKEYNVVPTEKTGWDYRIDKAATFQLVPMENSDPLKPWEQSPIGLRGQMFNSAGKSEDVTLVPEGTTLLRRVTFPASSPTAQ